MPKPKQTIALTLSVVLLSTNVLFAHKPETNIWEERRKNVQSAPPQMAQLSNFAPFPSMPFQRTFSTHTTPALKADVDPRLSTLISALTAYGTIREVKKAKSNSKNDAPILIYIQDIHGLLEAQKNIASMIFKVLDQQPNALIGLEGTKGNIPIAKFRKSTNEINKEVGSFFLNTGLITGAEYAGFAAKAEPHLFGVEDKDLYLKHVAAVREALPQQKGQLAKIEKEKVALQLRKRGVYSAEMMGLDQKWGDYHEGSLSVGDYLSELQLNRQAEGNSGSAPRSPANHNGGQASRYTRVTPNLPNIALFLKTWSLEKSLDFDKAERERNQFLSQLVGRLDKSRLDQLVERSTQLHTGTLAYPEYYRLLKETAASAGLALSKTPEFDRYITYVLQADAIHPELFLSEVSQFEKEIWDRLCTTPEQKTLRESAVKLQLTEKLVRLTLTPKEWGEYRTSFLVPRSSLTAFEAFYEFAEARNGAIAKNVLSVIARSEATKQSHDTRPLEIASAINRPRNDKLAVLVAGGFHADGLNQLLAKENLTIITVTPKLTKVDNTRDNEYLSVFTREKTPLEKLFEAPKISIVKTLSTESLEPNPTADVVARLASILPIPIGTALLKGSAIQETASQTIAVATQGSALPHVSGELVMQGTSDRLQVAIFKNEMVQGGVLDFLKNIHPAVWIGIGIGSVLIAVTYLIIKNQKYREWRKQIKLVFDGLTALSAENVKLKRNDSHVQFALQELTKSVEDARGQNHIKISRKLSQWWSKTFRPVLLDICHQLAPGIDYGELEILKVEQVLQIVRPLLPKDFSTTEQLLIERVQAGLQKPFDSVPLTPVYGVDEVLERIDKGFEKTTGEKCAFDFAVLIPEDAFTLVKGHVEYKINMTETRGLATTISVQNFRTFLLGLKTNISPKTQFKIYIDYIQDPISPRMLAVAKVVFIRPPLANRRLADIFWVLAEQLGYYVSSSAVAYLVAHHYMAKGLATLPALTHGFLAGFFVLFLLLPVFLCVHYVLVVKNRRNTDFYINGILDWPEVRRYLTYLTLRHFAFGVVTLFVALLVHPVMTTEYAFWTGQAVGTALHFVNNRWGRWQGKYVSYGASPTEPMGPSPQWLQTPPIILEALKKLSDIIERKTDDDVRRDEALACVRQFSARYNLMGRKDMVKEIRQLRSALQNLFPNIGNENIDLLSADEMMASFIVDSIEEIARWHNLAIPGKKPADVAEYVKVFQNFDPNTFIHTFTAFVGRKSTVRIVILKLPKDALLAKIPFREWEFVHNVHLVVGALDQLATAFAENATNPDAKLKRAIFWMVVEYYGGTARLPDTQPVPIEDIARNEEFVARLLYDAKILQLEGPRQQGSHRYTFLEGPGNSRVFIFGGDTRGPDALEKLKHILMVDFKPKERKQWAVVQHQRTRTSEDEPYHGEFPELTARFAERFDIPVYYTGRNLGPWDTVSDLITEAKMRLNPSDPERLERQMLGTMVWERAAVIEESHRTGSTHIRWSAVVGPVLQAARIYAEIWNGAVDASTLVFCAGQVSVRLRLSALDDPASLIGQTVKLIQKISDEQAIDRTTQVLIKLRGEILDHENILVLADRRDRLYTEFFKAHGFKPGPDPSAGAQALPIKQEQWFHTVPAAIGFLVAVFFMANGVSPANAIYWGVFSWYGALLVSCILFVFIHNSVINDPQYSHLFTNNLRDRWSYRLYLLIRHFIFGFATIGPLLGVILIAAKINWIAPSVATSAEWMAPVLLFVASIVALFFGHRAGIRNHEWNNIHDRWNKKNGPENSLGAASDPSVDSTRRIKNALDVFLNDSRSEQEEAEAGEIIFEHCEQLSNTQVVKISLLLAFPGLLKSLDSRYDLVAALLFSNNHTAESLHALALTLQIPEIDNDLLLWTAEILNRHSQLLNSKATFEIILAIQRLNNRKVMETLRNIPSVQKMVNEVNHLARKFGVKGTPQDDSFGAAANHPVKEQGYWVIPTLSLIFTGMFNNGLSPNLLGGIAAGLVMGILLLLIGLVPQVRWSEDYFQFDHEEMRHKEIFQANKIALKHYHGELNSAQNSIRRWRIQKIIEYIEGSTPLERINTYKSWLKWRYWIFGAITLISTFAFYSLAVWWWGPTYQWWFVAGSIILGNATGILAHVINNALWLLRWKGELPASSDETPALIPVRDVTVQADDVMFDSENEEVAKEIKGLIGPLERDLVREMFNFGEKSILYKRFVAQVRFAKQNQQDVHNPKALRIPLMNAAYLAGRAGLPRGKTRVALAKLWTDWGCGRLGWLRLTIYWIRGRVEQVMINVCAWIIMEFKFWWGTEFDTDATIGFHIDALLKASKDDSVFKETQKRILQRYKKNPRGVKDIILVRRDSSGNDDEDRKKLIEELQRNGVANGVLQYINKQVLDFESKDGLINPNEVKEHVKSKLGFKNGIDWRLDMYTATPEQFDLHYLVNAVIYSICGGRIMPVEEQVRTARVLAVGA